MTGKKSKIIAAVVMMAPFTLIFLVFTIIPIFSSLVLSFTNFDMLNAPVFTGFTNYIRMFGDRVLVIALRNTVMFALITGPLGFAVCFLFAWLINEWGSKIRAVFTLMFYAPTLAGNVYFIWLFIFSGDSYGIINSNLMRLGFIKDPILWTTDPRYNFWVVVVVMLWMSLGAGFLSFIAGLQGINPEHYEAGAIDGIKNRWQELFYITIPQMVPQMLFATVMAIAVSFAVGYQAMALTGFPSTDYSTHTIVLHLLDYGAIRFEMGYASALAVLLFALMLIVWTVIKRLLSRLSENI